MELQTLTYIVVGLTFALYIGIAIWAKASTTGEFYVAGKGIPPVLNGMATAADWMSAASFISMAGLIAFLGYGGSVFLMGWTGGYVLMAMLLAPYLRKFGKFTVPEFIGDRYYSNTARVVAVICLIIASVTYVIGQMKGIGVAFSRFLEVDYGTGLIVGMAIVFFYAVLGGMKGITYTQIAQYCVLILAYTIPAVFISLQLTGHPLPQIGLGSTLSDGSGTYLLDKLDQVVTELGFAEYTTAKRLSTTNMFVYTLSLMIGTAGLPHVIIRFFTVPKVRDARTSAGWALVFIAILYTTAPGVAAMARLNLMQTIQPAAGQNLAYDERPSWFKNWEKTGLLKFGDWNNDGKIQYYADKVAYIDDKGNKKKASLGETRGKLLAAESALAKAQEENNATAIKKAEENIATAKSLIAKLEPEQKNLAHAEGKGWNGNEMYKVDRDIMVLANPEIAQLPNWVIALVAAGGLAAALSTAAGLLLAIASSISHDLLKGIWAPGISEKSELMASRVAMAGAIALAGYFGFNPPDFAAGTVALAFGLAASSLFPALMMGIFSKHIGKMAAISGMVAGIGVTLLYVFQHKGVMFVKSTSFLGDMSPNWFLGIEPNAFGAIGAMVNFGVAFAVHAITKEEPPEHIQHLVEDIRVPSGSGAATGH